MAPDPGRMALWNFADFVEAKPFLRARHDHVPAPVREAGLCRNFGADIP